MKARYIRVSSAGQNTARQLAKQHPDEKLYIDVISGSIPFNQRPEAKKFLFDIIEGSLNIDTISVSSVDRLGRNAFDIQKTINHLKDRNINLIVDNLGISSMVDGKENSIFKMITDVLANVAQMEKESLRERQLEGIEIAKQKGVYNGRVKGTTESDEVVLAKYKQAVKAIKMNSEMSLRQLAKLGDCSMNTIKKLKEILNDKGND